MSKATLNLLLLTITLLTLGNPAYAYLDPGNGSMLTQILLGGAGGLTVLLKYYWGSISAFFKRTPVPPTPSERQD